ncbi:carboxypeptidase regulatory-like domain-containing protein [Lapillicoccus sp.]|uniref:carboxypeptidase regulatory-like domain-containing protein n=1 Tax=Lapillicoccus sp. TaxID=1909287 RepID=UPI0032636556
MTDREHDQSRLDELELGVVDDVDGRALATLRRIYEVGDPVPPSLLDRVKFAITLDDLEAEVAMLQRESLPELAGARSDDLLRARTVTFTSDTLTTMVTITPLENDGVRLDGWAAPGAFLNVELRIGEQTRHVTADEDGRFVFEHVDHGLAQLVLRQNEAREGDHPVITPAIEI